MPPMLSFICFFSSNSSHVSAVEESHSLHGCLEQILQPTLVQGILGVLGFFLAFTELLLLVLWEFLDDEVNVLAERAVALYALNCSSYILGGRGEEGREGRKGERREGGWEEEGKGGKGSKGAREGGREGRREERISDEET